MPNPVFYQLPSGDSYSSPEGIDGISLEESSLDGGSVSISGTLSLLCELLDG